MSHFMTLLYCFWICGAHVWKNIGFMTFVSCLFLENQGMKYCESKIFVSLLGCVTSVYEHILSHLRRCFSKRCKTFFGESLFNPWPKVLLRLTVGPVVVLFLGLQLVVDALQARPRSGSKAHVFWTLLPSVSWNVWCRAHDVARCLIGDWRACDRNGRKRNSSICPGNGGWGQMWLRWRNTKDL